MQVNNICCIGAGYVGGPSMAVIAQKNPDIKVTVVDANLKKIRAWNGPLDKLPVYEPGLSNILEKTRGKNLFFSNHISKAINEAQLIFMAVNTPTKIEGEGAGMAADLENIVACAKDIAKYSDSDKIVVEKSTVPIRTAEKIKEILNSSKSNVKFEILSNPEFLAEGTAIEDMFSPDRVLIGGDETESGSKAVQVLVKIYSNWVSNDKIYTTNVWSSELSKLASNAMLAQRVSSINSLSAFCEKTGADIEELSKAIGMDSRIGPKFLRASVGFGGSCFQKDILNLVYLCKFYRLNEVAEYWHQVVKINNYQKNRIAEKVIAQLDKNLERKKILLLGWAFKANTNDSRESPAIQIGKKLYEAGAILHIYDPMVSSETILDDIKREWIITNKKNKQDDLVSIFHSVDNNFYNEKYDAILILTNWDEFSLLDWKNIFSKNTFVFDMVNVLKGIKNYNLFKLGKQ